jgi:hypothetical protein
MQPHDMKGRGPDNDTGPGSQQTRWLILLIAILLGVLVSQLLQRLV